MSKIVDFFKPKTIEVPRLCLTDGDDWKKWSMTVAMAALNMADTKLKHSLEINKKISDRAFSLLTTCVTVFLLLSGWLLDTILKFSEFHVLLCISIQTLVILIVAMFLLFGLLFPVHLYSAGSDPRSVLRDDLLVYPFKDEGERGLYVILQECEDLQCRIDHNTIRNARRQTRIEWVLGLLIAILPLSLLTFIIYP